ncbi:hypothetical protein [Streptomyces sp. NPDC056987]|uniref:hypothetical protein n=1 Tax=Streptomyces sp. NPDC056987 TaxID=3345988 RepID=UPI003634017C
MTDHAAAARRHRAYEAAFVAGCIGLSAVALWCAASELWAEGVFFGVTAAVMAGGAARSGADYRAARARAAGDTSGPCCPTWTASHHTVHSARCTHTNPPYQNTQEQP